MRGQAGCGPNNSGLPVGPLPGPGLGVGPTTPATAGKARGLPSTFFPYPYPRLKVVRGPPDAGLPGGGEAAMPSSDQIQINRNKKLGRGKHCGRYSVRGRAPDSPETRFHRVNCKSWNCSYCGPRRSCDRILPRLRSSISRKVLKSAETKIPLSQSDAASSPVWCALSPEHQIFQK